MRPHGTQAQLEGRRRRALELLDKGMFSVLLGSVTALNIPFDKPYFLEIKVGNEVMSPRQQIASSAYAMRAENADKAKEVDGVDLDKIGFVGTKAVDEAQLSDGKTLVYRVGSGKYEPEILPKISCSSDVDNGTHYFAETVFLSVTKNITTGKSVLLIASGYVGMASNGNGRKTRLKLKKNAEVVQEIYVFASDGLGAMQNWALSTVLTGLSGEVTFTVTADGSDNSLDSIAYGNLVVLDF